MLLKCPHCTRKGEHVRSDFFGDWVVCAICELPFAWRDARSDKDALQVQQDGTNGAGGQDR